MLLVLLDNRDHQASRVLKDCKVQRAHLEVKVLKAVQDHQGPRDKLVRQGRLEALAQLVLLDLLAYRDQLVSRDKLDRPVLVVQLDRRVIWEIPDFRARLEQQDQQVRP